MPTVNDAKGAYIADTNSSPKLNSSTSSAKALVGIWAILLTSFIAAALYFAREVLIPVALAALLTFLLAPVVSVLQRWLGRIGAVLLVVLLRCWNRRLSAHQPNG